MSDFWNDGLIKAIGGAFGGAVAALVSARAYRQRDRTKEAASVGEALVTEAEAAGTVSAIKSFSRLAELADKRAAEAEAREILSIQRAEKRELAAVERADRADALMREAIQQASNERLARQRAESRISELENRIAELESKIGNRGADHGEP